jgi:cobalamin biosynthesis protein CobC
MISPNPHAPLAHGGDLEAARRLFPGAPEPFLDLSTGINPHPYPIPNLPPENFAHLPDGEGFARLTRRAAEAYGAPSESNVAPAPGSQILMALLAGFVAPGRAAILGPTYAEHERVAALAGHRVATVSELAPLADADLAIVVNPNNPDGRVFTPDALLAVAERQRAHGGLLIVDEAFMDACPRGESLSGHVEGTNLAVIRSFGKFFGLAGVRLSFAIGGEDLVARLRAHLGPWPASGPALAIGNQALSDMAWIERTRQVLDGASRRLDALLEAAGLEKIGGTALFTLVRGPEAQQVFERLGRAGIFVRRFDYEPCWLRFGLPGHEEEWKRLEDALRA